MLTVPIGAWATCEVNNYNQLNFYQMRPNLNPLLFYVTYPLKMFSWVERYSDIDISVNWTQVITNINDFVLR